VPIYEYQCTACGNRFELIQKLSDSPRRKCEKCKGKAERLISSPAIQFKGTGWYVTDYARKGSSGGDTDAASSSKAESSEKKSAKKSSGKSGKKEKTGAASG
jgi:putative FmdB family regulatory protein